MIEIDFERLRCMGMTPALWQHLQAQLNEYEPATMLMRVVEVQPRETVTLHDGAAERSARVLPRVLRDLADAVTGLAVGDWVLARDEPPDACWLQRRLVPLQHVARRGYMVSRMISPPAL